MKKMLFKALAVCAAVVTLSSAAFAATVANGIVGTVPTNASQTVAAELLPAAGLSIANGLQVYYKAPNNFNPNDVLQFNTAGLTLTESTFKLCDATTLGIGVANTVADYLGGTDTTNGVTNLIFRFNTTVTGNDVLYVASTCETTTAVLPYTTANAALDIKVTGAASISTPPGTFAGGTILTAQSVAAPLYTVANQFNMTTTGFIPAGGAIDFPGGLKTVAGASKVFTTGTPLALADSGIAAPLGLGNPTTFSTNDKITFTLSGATLSGISKICYEAGTAGTCAGTLAFALNTAASIATYDDALSGQTAGPATNKAITFVFDGINSLTARSYSLAATLAFGSAAKNGHPLFSGLTANTLTLNSTQYYIPMIKSNGAVGTTETYIKLQSKNTFNSTNGVYVQILCGGAVVANQGLSSQLTPSTPTITPGTSYVLTGTQLMAMAAGITAPATPSSCTVDGNAGFAAIITVNAPNTDVFAYASMIDPNGFKRVPVQTLNTISIGGAMVNE
jgi:hypothetical protein